MSEPTGITRRQAIANIGAVGIAALGGQAALSAQGEEESMATRKLEDPTAKYPKPPFREQSQPWPGPIRSRNKSIVSFPWSIRTIATAASNPPLRRAAIVRSNSSNLAPASLSISFKSSGEVKIFEFRSFDIFFGKPARADL
jgi:hypothetical protein